MVRKLKSRWERGFTLMEIMIVVAIIMLLSAVGLSSFIFSQQKARDSQRKSDLGQIRRSLELFSSDLGSYPTNDALGKILGCGTSSALVTCEWGGLFRVEVGGVDQTYMTKLPQEPRSASNYYYESDGESYAIYSTLENEADPACRDDLVGIDCGGEGCKYKVTNEGVEYGSGTQTCELD